MDKFLLSYLEKKYGVGVNTPLYKAATELLKRLWQGSVCIPADDSLANSAAVGRSDRDRNRPLIFDNGNLYIQKYFVYQERILKRLGELKFHIITGGPGTGKTTSLANILKGKDIETISLAAPTGKAALRMTQSLANQGIEKESKTLHRLLGGYNQLDAKIIAVDECSMIDLSMMSKLLNAVPNDCDLYLLGDKNQLASVEAGSVFADLCEKYKGNDKVYDERTKGFRLPPGIDKLSKQILSGDVKSFENEDVHYFQNDKLSAEVFNRYDVLFNAENEKAALDFLETFQILCATNVGKYGTIQVNRELCNLAKQKKAKYTPIIITENNYSLNLFNGDVGVMDKEFAYFYSGKDGIKSFQALTLPTHSDAFAITIHKSQGSEYDDVAVVYPDSELEKEFLTRELLYTAITRAKKKCFIFGDENVLLKSCEHPIIRASGIK